MFDCNACCCDRCKLRETVTGAARKGKKRDSRSRKGSLFVFLGVLLFCFCFFVTPVHPTFMPIKQLELKHRGREAGWSEAERSLPM